ncbi:aminoglycoside phosphotransferase [Trypanosoma grayi]|uniref:aminoglycoside phosphotransferase n=1 Tax=Trypanosoma grayi TaxID=71804 RepID=UPI0004F4A0FA|nr:aminoglycoside phosphotransferase [Trypanosoma grayi]KEG09731.1 aminoglycoside phosphotransferase [Trypanosoma grayi]
MPEEVILMFDVAGVLTTSPYPASRRLAETVMRCVFERAEAHLRSTIGNESPSLLAQHYSSFFSLVRNFTENARGCKGAFERLELGEINRVQFVSMFHAEMEFMLTALSKKNPEELDLMRIANPKRVVALRERYPLLGDPVIQELVRELVDSEAFLCTMEKVSPRRNVLNLLHYLRMKSQQEIRLVVVANTWEVEGQYARMSKALSNAVGDSNWSYFPSSCPIDYNKGGVKSSFLINGLFDAYVQSYTFHNRKPFPDIFIHATDEAMKTRMLSEASIKFDVKPHIFLFDDVLENCETARNLPDSSFEKVYYVENGAYDVYEDVLDALKTVGATDSFWAEVARGVESDVSPLFKPPRDPQGKPTSWINEEMYNYNNNLLILPPPLCEACEPRGVLESDSFLNDNDKDAILFYCAQHLPHLFPIDIPSTYTRNLQLARKPGFATSAGPIVFEPMWGSGFFKTYRITLRTGSYVLRVQPSGPMPYGTVDIRTECEVVRYLSQASLLPLANCLLYCDSYSANGHRFSLRRYVDGEIITHLSKLIQPRIHRPYSKGRQVVNLEFDPRRFFLNAIVVLVELHSVPLLPFLSRHRGERPSNGSTNTVHPLLEKIKEWDAVYRKAVDAAKLEDGTSIFQSRRLERLSQALVDAFDETRLRERQVPYPERLVLIHGRYKLQDLIFAPRSFEGRHKYPPQLLGVMNFNCAGPGDPLVDVASLALMALLRPPRGICDMPSEARALFPTPQWILDKYCRATGYMRELPKKKRESIFNVYMSAMCLRYAVTLTSQLSEVHKLNNELSLKETRNLSVIEHAVQQGLAVIHERHSRL